MKKVHRILVFILLLLGMSTFSYIPILIFKIDINRLSTSLKILYEFSCDLGFMLILYVLYHKILNKNFKDYFKKFKDNFRTSIKYYGIGLAIMVISNTIISIFFSSANANNENAVRSLIDMFPVYMIFSVGIYAPFIEELIFRKSIKDIVDGYGKGKIAKYTYIILSGLIFALLHIIGISTNPIDYLYIIPYLALGIAFASLYYKTNNIFSTIIMHSLHNIIAIILYLVVKI